MEQNEGSQMPRCRRISTRAAMEFNFLNAKYILDTLVGSLATVATGETFCSKFKTASHSENDGGR